MLETIFNLEIEEETWVLCPAEWVPKSTFDPGVAAQFSSEGAGVESPSRLSGGKYVDCWSEGFLKGFSS